MKIRALVLGVSMVAGYGCGSSDDGDGGGGGLDEGPAATMGTANPVAMKSTVGQADSLLAGFASGDGDTVSGSVMAFSSSGMGSVMAGSAQASVPESMTGIVAADGEATGTKMCDATTCTYMDYGRGNMKITGTVTATDGAAGGKSIVWELSGKDTRENPTGLSNFVADTLSTIWKGNVTVSSTSLTGAAGFYAVVKGTLNMAKLSATTGSLTKFLSVAITDKCPTAGSVYAKTWQTLDINGTKPAEQNKAVEATHTFSGCQQ
jgi:hypothetical protein